MRWRRAVLLVALASALAAPVAASEWDRGDVDAAERYREIERERAERFRAERGVAAPAPVPAAARASAGWLDRLLEPFDFDAIRDLFARLSSWLDWLERDLVPFFERWLAKETPRASRAAPAPVTAPPPVERRAPEPKAALPAPPAPPADDSWLPDSLRDPAPRSDPAREWREEERRRLEAHEG